MTAYDFPNSPTNGQVVTTTDGLTRKYDSATNTWSVIATNITGPAGSSGSIGVLGVIQNTGTSTAAILGISGGTSGQLLTSNGTGQATFQDAPVSLPSQTGNSGLLLTTNGSTASWSDTITDLTTTSFVNAQTRLYAGASAYTQTAVSTNPIIVAKDAGAAYVQSALINSSSTGSADYAAYGDNGTDASGWVDMGFTGSNFSDSAYTITGKNDGYIFTQAVSGAGLTGNLVLATGGNGTGNDIIFATGGFLAANEKMRLDHTTGDLLLPGQVIDHINFSQKTTSYSLLLADDGYTIETNSASANNITIPLNSSQAFPVGTQITIVQTGIGQTTIVPTTVTTQTYSSGGALGATTFVLASATGVLAGQLVTGTGIAANTYVVSVATNTVTISQATTAQVAGTITFSIPVFGTPGLKLRAQWSSATLIKRQADSRTSTNYASDSWMVIGDLTT